MRISPPSGVWCGGFLPRRLAQWRRAIKRGKRVPGAAELFLPGERSAREEARCLERGFPVAAELRDELNALAEALGVRQRL